MSEIDTQQAEGVPQATQAAADTTAAGSQPDKQGDGAGQADQQPADSTKANDAGNGIPAPKADAKPQESGNQEDSKPRSRRSAQYRIEQLARENADLRKQVGKPATDEGQQQDQGDPPPDQTVDVRKAVREEAQRMLEPVLKEHSQAADDNELNELFTGDNAGKKAEYESKIREAWKLEQYRDLAASDLFKILSYDTDLAKARLDAVEAYKESLKAAKESSGSGANNTINRTGEGGISVANMTDAELEAHNAKIKAGIAT